MNEDTEHKENGFEMNQKNSIFFALLYALSHY